MLSLQIGARPERFELPTTWFEGWNSIASNTLVFR